MYCGLAELPLLCSQAVGANSAFLEDAMNGYIFETNNASAIEKMMNKIILKTPPELLSIVAKSALKAVDITPQKWVSSLMSELTKK